MKTLKLRPTFLAFLLFSTLGFLLYLNSIHGEFIYDDIINIETNPLMHNARNLKWISGFYATRFFPYFSLSLNYFFHQDHTFGYHLVNIILHITNTLFVFLLTQLLLQTKKLDIVAEKDRYLFSLLTALIFLTHPIQTQAVSSIVQRITLLSTTFYLGSGVLYLKSRLENRKTSWILAIILCVMAMASRENAATLPFILCFMEIYLIQSSRPTPKIKTFKSLAPFFLSLIIIPSLLLYSMNWGRPLTSIIQETDSISRSTYFLTQTSVLNTYLLLFLFPISQNADYDYPLTHSPLNYQFLLGACVLLLLTLLVLRWGRRHAVLILGWAWFLITLSVESSFIPIKDVIQEHRLYLPMIGLSWILSYAIVQSIRSSKTRFTLINVLLLLYCTLTISRNQVWKSNVAFWQDTAAKSPSKSRAHMGLGAAYLRTAVFPEAEKHLHMSILLDPENLAGHANLGILYFHTGNSEKALFHMEKAYSFNPGEPLYTHHLGYMYMELSQYERAFYFYRKLLDTSFSSYTADQYFRALAHYYGKTHDLAATLIYAEALEKHFTPDEYQEILGLLKRLVPPSP